MKHIVVDLEMNGLAKEYKEERQIWGREVIEIGAVVLDDLYHEIGSFETLVKPQFNDRIAPYFSNLTGITTEMVAEAPHFEEALKMFFAWCRSMDEQVHIYQWSESDLEQLVKEIELKGVVLNSENQKMLSNWEDFQKEYGETLHLENAVSLKNAAMYAGVDFEGREHDALDDARNTATLLKIVRTPELCKNALEHVIDALTPSPEGNTLGSLFNFAELGFSA